MINRDENTIRITPTKQIKTDPKYAIQKLKSNWTKSTKTWVTINCVLIALWLAGCNHVNKDNTENCDFDLHRNSRIFMYTDTVSKSNDLCVYSLKSNYFEDGGLIQYINDEIHIKANPGLHKFEKLMSFSQPAPQINYITITPHIPLDNTRNKHKFIVDKFYIINDKKVALIKIPNINLKHSNDSFLLDAHLFVSEEKGFIGSYYKSKLHPNMIILAAGDILKNSIDYSNIEFYTIE